MEELEYLAPPFIAARKESSSLLGIKEDGGAGASVNTAARFVS